jgi:hypothetical protein
MNSQPLSSSNLLIFILALASLFAINYSPYQHRRIVVGQREKSPTITVRLSMSLQVYFRQLSVTNTVWVPSKMAFKVLFLSICNDKYFTLFAVL